MVYLDNGGHLRQAPGSRGLRQWYDKRALVKIENGVKQYKVGGVARFYKENNKYRLEYDSANEQWVNDPKSVKSGIFAQLKEKSEISQEFDENSNFKFSFERDLEDHLVQNLGSLEEGLNLHSNNGKTGKQFNTPVGRIDILAQDKKGDLVVIELKMGLVGSDVLAQIMPYIGWIEENLSSGKSVRAIIVGSDFDKKLKYAVYGLPITLKKYEVRFEFEDIGRIAP